MLSFKLCWQRRWESPSRVQNSSETSHANIDSLIVLPESVFFNLSSALNFDYKDTETETRMQVAKIQLLNPDGAVGVNV